jgi:hypothetical protein
MNKCPRCGLLITVHPSECPHCAQKRQSKRNVPSRSLRLLQKPEKIPLPDKTTLLRDWRNGLQHADPEWRSATIEALAKSGDLGQAKDALITLLTDDPDCFVRGHAAEALCQINDPGLLDLFLWVFEHDDHWYTRTIAVEFFGRSRDPRVKTLLVKAMWNRDPSVKAKVIEIFERYRLLVETDAEYFAYLVAKEDDVQILAFAEQAILPLQTLSTQYSRLQYPGFHKQIQKLLEQIYAQIEIVVFGKRSPSVVVRNQTIWHNPDVEHLRIPLSCLRRIEIDANTADSYDIERFLTYALAYLGQTYLERTVDVQITGNPEQLHPNVRNNLCNLCHSVEGLEEL